MSAGAGMTKDEAIRHAFHQGYLFALDQVGTEVRSRPVEVVLNALRLASAQLLAKSAIAKAGGNP